MDRKFIISIDGASSTGKSTLARKISNLLKFIHIDSGAMYRAVTLFAKNNHLLSNNLVDKNALIKLLPNIKVDFVKNNIHLNDTDVSKDVRDENISNFVSRVAEIPEVRSFLVTKQRNFTINHNVVMDGRDIGSVVFPNADIKFFLHADLNIRVERRYNELKSLNSNICKEKVKLNIIQRDYTDSNRQDSPLIVPENAISIDVSEFDINSLFEFMMKKIHIRLSQ
jgi:cytidylate kinase